MHPYGHTRKDKLECDYGCCTFKSGKDRKCREVVDRANKKTARQEGRRQLFTDLCYNTSTDTTKEF